MFDVLLWTTIIVLILLPPSLDPAIRIKMRQVMRGTHPESKGAEWIVWVRQRDNDGRLYMTLKGWSTTRKDAIRFSSGEAAVGSTAHFPKGMKSRTFVEMY